VVLPQGQTKKLTQLNEDLLRYRQLGEVREVNYSSLPMRYGSDTTSALQIQGYIVLPPAYDAARKYLGNTSLVENLLLSSHQRWAATYTTAADMLESANSSASSAPHALLASGELARLHAGANADLNTLRLGGQACVRDDGPGVYAYRGAYAARTGILLDENCPTSRPSPGTQVSSETDNSDVSPQVYPTVATGAVTLDYPKGYTEATVLNAQGRVIESFHLTGTRHTLLRAANMPSGVYFIHFESNGAEFESSLLPVTLRFVRK